jgi:hypothetical protein
VHPSSLPSHPLIMLSSLSQSSRCLLRATATASASASAVAAAAAGGRITRGGSRSSKGALCLHSPHRREFSAAAAAAAAVHSTSASASSSSSSPPSSSSSPLAAHDVFVGRHLGPSSDADVATMLKTIGYPTLDALIDATVPRSIRSARPLSLPPQGETEALHDLRDVMSANLLYRSYIGLGYYDCITPPVILRNIIENPAWYTPYTPYQAEIAQGRLEMLLNFQTAVADLTALPVANSSLLDEGTAAAEAMNMAYNGSSKKKRTFLISEDVHPQTIAVVKTRAKGVDITVKLVKEEQLDLTGAEAGQWVEAQLLSPSAHRTPLSTARCDDRHLVRLTAMTTADTIADQQRSSSSHCSHSPRSQHRSAAPNGLPAVPLSVSCRGCVWSAAAVSQHIRSRARLQCADCRSSRC